MIYAKRAFIGCLLLVFGWWVAALPLGPVAAACDSPPADKGQTAGKLTAETAGPYRLWLRMFAPDSNHDSVYVQVDDQCVVTATGASGEGFIWVGTKEDGAPLAFDLTAGEHTITLAGRDAGAGVDKAMLVASSACVPIGIQGECPPGVQSPQEVRIKQAQDDSLNIALIAVCAVLIISAFGFVVWKYVTFTKSMAASSSSGAILVGSGLSQQTGLLTKLAHFLRHHKVVVFVCACIIVASIIVGIVFAAQGGPSFEAEEGALKGGAKIVDHADASGGKFVQFEAVVAAAPPPTTPPAAKAPAPGSTGGGSTGGSATPDPGPGDTPPPPGGGSGNGYPDASNTGPVGCGGSYTTHSGTLDITVDGTVINCLWLDGTLTINASNVTVQNSILRGTSWWGVRVGNTKSSTTNFKLLHSKLETVPTFGPDNGGYDYGISQESSGYMEIAYNDISGYKDGVTISNGSVHDNYIHDFSVFDGAHTQAVYVYTGSGQVKIDHNTLLNDSPYDQATAAIYIAPDDGHQNDRMVTNNYMAGGAFTLYGGDNTATNIVVTNNKFSVQCVPGPDDEGCYGAVAYWWPNNAGNVWSGNTWADGPSIGQAVNP